MTEKSLLYTVMVLLGMLMLPALREEHDSIYLYAPAREKNISYVNAYGGIHNPVAIQLLRDPLAVPGN